MRTVYTVVGNGFRKVMQLFDLALSPIYMSFVRSSSISISCNNRLKLRKRRSM